jgi:hypothetical protein
VTVPAKSEAGSQKQEARLDWDLYGDWAGGHHITSLLFHLANSVFLFIVFRRMTGSVYRSALVAALFALHPLHVESVAWISERKDVLNAFFWILTVEESRIRKRS